MTLGFGCFLPHCQEPIFKEGMEQENRRWFQQFWKIVCSGHCFRGMKFLMSRKSHQRLPRRRQQLERRHHER